MKKLLYFCCVLAIASSFACNGNAKPNDDVDTLSDSTKALSKVQTSDMVKARATSIYIIVLTSYNKAFDEKDTTAQEGIDPEAFLSADLKELIRRCNVKQEKTDDLFLDYDYWINAQDYQDLELESVDIVSYTNKKAKAEVHFHNFGKENIIRLTLVYDKNQDDWFVDDFYYPETKTSFRKYCDNYLIDE